MTAQSQTSDTTGAGSQTEQTGTPSETSGDCPYLCEDGSCVDSPTECPPYNGCGGSFPILVILPGKYN